MSKIDIRNRAIYIGRRDSYKRMAWFSVYAGHRCALALQSRHVVNERRRAECAEDGERPADPAPLGACEALAEEQSHTDAEHKSGRGDGFDFLYGQGCFFHGVFSRRFHAARSRGRGRFRRGTSAAWLRDVPRKSPRYRVASADRSSKRASNVEGGADRRFLRRSSPERGLQGHELRVFWLS